MIDPEEERAEFISLHEVLFLIAKETGFSPMKAAKWLAYNLNKNPEWQKISFKNYSELQGIEEIDDYAKYGNIRSSLERLAKEGIAKTREWEASDDLPF